MLGVRLDNELDSRLTALAQRTQRSKSYHAKAALARYIAQEEENEQANVDTLARWEFYKENDESISNQSVMNWLDTWGTEQEQPCPEK